MPARRPTMLTNRELEKPIVFAWLSESVRLEMAKHAGGRVESLHLFKPLAILKATFRDNRTDRGGVKGLADASRVSA